MPEFLTGKIKTSQVTGSVDRIHTVSVCGHGAGSHTGVFHHLQIIGIRILRHLTGPEQRAIRRVKAIDLLPALVCPGHEEPIAPDNRRIMALARQGDFPRNACAFRAVPLGGNVTCMDHAGPILAPEPIPVASQILVRGHRRVRERRRGLLCDGRLSVRGLRRQQTLALNGHDGEEHHKSTGHTPDSQSCKT